jgi:hypothetical protein
MLDGSIDFQKIEPQRVFCLVYFFQQPAFEQHPTPLIQVTLEYTLLHSLTVILAGLSHATQPARACFIHRRNIVSYNYEHLVISDCQLPIAD